MRSTYLNTTTSSVKFEFCLLFFCTNLTLARSTIVSLNHTTIACNTHLFFYVVFCSSPGNQTVDLVEKPLAWFPSLEFCPNCEWNRCDLSRMLRIYRYSLWLETMALALKTKLLTVCETGCTSKLLIVC